MPELQIVSCPGDSICVLMRMNINIGAFLSDDFSAEMGSIKFMPTTFHSRRVHSLQAVSHLLLPERFFMQVCDVSPSIKREINNMASLYF
jgi:hypothetical protein